MPTVIPTELGTEKISKLLKQYALPAIIAMTASSLYNMCDSIFIGQGVGPYAIAGLAITFPLMNLSAACGTLVGVGASTIISVLLGQKNYKVAQKVLGNSVVLNVIVGLLFSVFCIAFLKPILFFFGASPNTMSYAYDYMFIILLGNIVTNLYFGMNNIVRVMGLPKKAMGATIFTVVINSILDPIFIFVFHWGVRGAAIATVLSQFLAMLYVFYLASDKNRIIHLKKGIYKLEAKIIKKTFSIGMSPFLMNAASCFIVLFLNQQLKRYGGDMAIGAFGIVNRMSFLFIMVVMGLNQGMQPIAGYNFGADKPQRVSKVLRTTILLATAVTSFGFVIGELFPRQLAFIFTTDPELIRQSVIGLRITFISFPIIGFQMVTAYFFQSIGFAKKAVFLSLSRQVLFLLPLLFLMPTIWGIHGVWWSLPVSDLIASVVSGFMLAAQHRVFIRMQQEQDRQSEQQLQTSVKPKENQQ
ncbi:MAG: MATE family efflux transporter [Bacteroidales bacterium]